MNPTQAAAVVDYTFKASDLAIVFATLFGPILALMAQRLLDGIRAKQARREHIYRTLMTTRALNLSPEHVQALNLISLEFHDEKAVTKAWREYLDHLSTPQGTTEVEGRAWLNASQDKFIELLDVMGRSVGYDFDRVQLKREIYSPTYHAKLENEASEIRRNVLAVLKGEQSLKMDVTEFPSDDQMIATQHEMNQRLLQWLRGQGAAKVEVVPSAQPAVPGVPAPGA